MIDQTYDKELILETKDFASAYFWARDVFKARWPEAESFIREDAKYAFLYARDVIRGRWPEAEDVVSTKPEYAYGYSQDVLNSELPEKMHNVMIMHGVVLQDNVYVKAYFESIKKNKSRQPYLRGSSIFRASTTDCTTLFGPA